MAVGFALPLLLAIGLVWLSRRRGALPALAALFLLGGLLSFALTSVLNGLLLPLEEAIGGAPDSTQARLASAFLTAALSEELPRLLIALAAALTLRGSAGRDIVLSCAMLGLGFAAYENVLYSLTVPGFVDVLIARLIPSLTHGTTALIMGSFLRWSLAERKWPRVGPLLLALAVPILLHGLYDFGAFVIEATDIPELPDEPTEAQMAVLWWPLTLLLLMLVLNLIELGWATWIVFALRRRPPSEPA
jgi:RsiW-degrading membrane proteinase PrsW (M82 family)